jgi:hypothetical protein
MKKIQRAAHGMLFSETVRNRSGKRYHRVEMWVPPANEPQPQASEMTINTRLRFEARTTHELILPRR